MSVRAWFVTAVSLLSASACTKHDVTLPDASSVSAPIVDAAAAMDASVELDADIDTVDASDASAPTDVVEAANAIRAAIIARDAHRLASLVHPTRGVRFSPYAYVDVKSDVILHAAEVETAFTSPKKRTWGAFDGSGEPIVMTTAKYFDSFVAFKMLGKCKPRVNVSLASGNTTNNLREAYGTAPFVEYYDRGLGDGLNWTALRLVFEKLNGRLYLVGVIHDVWTI